MAIAVAATVLAGLLRWAITPYVGVRVPYATFFLAVVVVVRYGGTVPAIAVMLAGELLALALWFPSGPWTTETMVSSLLYLASASAIIGLGRQMHTAQNDADARASEIQSRVDELAASQRRLQLATEVSGTGVFRWDIGPDRLYGENPESYRIFGRTPDLPKLSMAELLDAFVHPDDRDSLALALQHSRERQEHVHTLFRCRRRDGAWRWLEVAARYVYAEDGTAVEMVGALADITQRKLLEDELRGMATDLATADRRKDEFLATLAHELRNPLAPIRNGIGVLRRTALADVRAIQVVDVMERQMRHLVRLVDDLLDVSRITRGTLELRPQEQELTPLLRAAAEAARPLVEERGHRLSISLPTAPVHVRADATRLVQVLTNLLNNAAKYTPAGGAIEFGGERVGSQAHAWVRDNGKGIAAERLPRVFDLFVQFDPAVEREHAGLGIGLSMVKRIVELHGGRVAIASDGEGQGTRVDVWLPVSMPAAVAAPVGERAATPSRRVLVVDDNRDAADSLAMMLGLFGSETVVAYDGEDALVQAARFAPDVGFLDIGMPTMSGFELCRRLRATPGGKTMVLVAVTGWGQDEDRRRSQEAGFDVHLTKPVDPAAVEALLAHPPHAR